MPENSQQTQQSEGPKQGPDGTLIDQSPKPEGTKTPEKTEPKTEDDKTLLTEGEKKPEGTKEEPKKEEPKAPTVPEKYEFKAPEAWAEKGWELDAKLLEGATPLFKELGLSQEGAQKLVDFYAAQSQAEHEAAEALVTKQNKDWSDASKAEFGAKLPAMKIEISKALDALGKEVSEPFKAAMDETGMGNNPAFIRAVHALSAALVEGGHVNGKGPSKFGQLAPGKSERPTAAQAMYPNLPSQDA